MTHALLHLGAVLGAGMLTAAIGVMDQPRLGLARCGRLTQSCLHERLAHVFAQRLTAHSSFGSRRNSPSLVLRVLGLTLLRTLP